MGCKSASLNNKKIKNILLPVNPQEREKNAKKEICTMRKKTYTKKTEKKQRNKTESRAETTKAKKARQLLSIFVNLNQS